MGEYLGHADEPGCTGGCRIKVKCEKDTDKTRVFGGERIG